MVLITGHRRENFGQPFQQICESIALLARDFPHTLFVYPVHLNPQVRAPVHTLLGRQQNIFLLEPLDYPEFVWLMSQARLLLTDSGGVQEEAPSLGKPVLVMRRETERPEAVEVGAARLVGTERDAIVRAVTQLLCDEQAYANCQVDHNPYGDGRATERIVALIRTFESGPPARSKVTTHSQ